ncbi:MAG: hypothetical protein P9F75_19445 [Candidatus Contendobacter sp.]|nr:hypothetical protein [Candidatus Contendobacter sp.]
MPSHPDPTDWRIFLCGSPPMVAGAKCKAYLKKAGLPDIHADLFKVNDRCLKPRN